tara:strand:+ start:226 stop:1059 length:834 start_codon:yes stop_codon:yes gene_type:complete
MISIINILPAQRRCGVEINFTCRPSPRIGHAHKGLKPFTFLGQLKATGRFVKKWLSSAPCSFSDYRTVYNFSFDPIRAPLTFIIKVKSSYLRKEHYAFLWAIFVFIATFLMRSRDGFEPFFISEIFNWSEDTILTFGIRWALWLSVPVALFQSIRDRVGSALTILSLIIWWITVFSGLQPAVFNNSFDQDFQKFLKLLHYALSGCLMAFSAFLFFRLGMKKLGLSWLLISVLYCFLFLLNRYSGIVSLPNGAYAIVEYTYYFIFIAVFTFCKKRARA